MSRDGKRARLPWLKSRFALLALVLAGTCLGCSQHTTAKKQTQIIEDPNRNITKEIPVTFSQRLKRKVGIYTLETPSLQRGRNFHEVFAPMLTEYLREECPQIIVANTDPVDGGLRLTELPRLPSGQIDAYALAILGRQLGFSAVFSTMLKNIYLKDEEQGILWTKDTHFLIRVRIVAEAYDVRTATKFLDQSFSEEIEVDETEYRLLKENKGFSDAQISETYPELIEEIGSRFCDKLQDIP
jgi:hypothetical protein